MIEMDCAECKRLQGEEAQATTELAEAQEAFAAYILSTDEITPRFTELHNAADDAEQKLIRIRKERPAHEALVHPEPD